MANVIGMARLFFFVLTHPVGTFRFAQDIAIVIRCLTLDVFGSIAPLHRAQKEG